MPDALLHWMGVYRPEPIKEWWIGLTLLSAALKLWLALRLLRMRPYPFPAFAAYLVLATAAALAPNRRNWGLGLEIALAVATLLFCAEAIWAVMESSRVEDGRNTRGWSIAVALMVLGVTNAALLKPAPNYPASWYHLRMWSALAAWSALWGAVLHVWRFRYRVPRAFALHCCLGVAWFAPIVYGGLWRSTSTEWGRPDQWPVRIIGCAVQIVCLAAWHLLFVEPKGASAKVAVPG